ncbi:MAG: SET domain-containing protein-lysine N-methyltransferase [Beijerinckiaceae bacterium]
MDQQVIRAKVEVGAYGNIVRAAMPIQAGETIFYLSGDIVSVPTKYTIQLDAQRHVLNEDSDWDLMNHACEPNVRIDVQSREMVAVRDIEPGEELNFNYNTTEWSMTSPFACGCGSPKCAGEIRGFRFLTDQQRRDIAPYISPYIAQRWSDEIKAGKSSVASIDIRQLRPEVHVLAPYEIVNGKSVSPEYEAPEFRQEIDGWLKPLGLSWVWHETTLQNVPQVVAAIAASAAHGPVVAFNLCDGSEIDGYPGLSVVEALYAANIPFSGASAEFYESTTSKLKTKELLFATGVNTPAWSVVGPDGEVELPAEKYPVIVKPDISAGSYGIEVDSVCDSPAAVARKMAALRADPKFATTTFFAEQFVRGREFTALLVEALDEPLGLWVLPPCERVFDQRLPEKERFLVYDRYWELPDTKMPLPQGEKFYWYALASEDLQKRISDVARRAMRGVGGAGYARVDFRLDERTGELFVLEVNAQCGLSVLDSTTVGSMLKLSGTPMETLVTRILQHALTRH